MMKKKMTTGKTKTTYLGLFILLFSHYLSIGWLQTVEAMLYSNPQFI